MHLQHLRFRLCLVGTQESALTPTGSVDWMWRQCFRSNLYVHGHLKLLGNCKITTLTETLDRCVCVYVLLI